VPVTVVVGAQWGDEGKGKVTDLLAPEVDFVVRYQGGDNAGHTIVVGEQVYKLSLVPSGVLHTHITPVIGNGVVVNPQFLFEEMAQLEEWGISCEKLKISPNAHMIMPYHLELDKVTERYLGDNKLGTTKRGIGFAYADKATRMGLRIQDLFDAKIFRQKLDLVLREKNALLSKVYGRLPLDAKVIEQQYMEFAERMEPYVCDTTALLHDALSDGRHVLLEGAQATLLDLDHGTYPFVTSSNPIAGGASVGSGVAPRDITRTIGLAKAYVTRVGSGPFPTEFPEDEAEDLRKYGDEWGTRTGRARRVGWFDAVLARYADRLNGFTEIALTKLDVLTGYDKLRVCTAYEYEGEVYRDLPYHQTILHKCTPVYTELPGWWEDLSGVTDVSQLPQNARGYIAFLESEIGVPIRIVSVGPAREQTLHLAA
jgi:adenylosuccinate synthase